MNNIPERGDILWLTFNPQAGHEQAGRRPALVISPAAYNSKTNLALVCPIISQVKNYPFEVNIPTGLPITGVILSDQVKSLDWRARQTEVICALPADIVAEVIGKLSVLLGQHLG